MAGASEIAVAGIAQGRRERLRRLHAHTRSIGPSAGYALIALGVSLLTWLVWAHPASDQYDNFFALDWGREIAHGALPTENAPFAATPHPLTMLLAAPLSALGETHAFRGIQVVNTLAWGAVVAAAVLIARDAFDRSAAALTGLLLVTNTALIQTVDSALSDGLFAALALTALAVELRRPHRGALVLLLLGAAGLARPEGWLLAAGYWAYTARGRDRGDQIRLAALALAAPIAWVALDAAATGHPLFSLSTTRDNTILANRATGIGNVLPQLRFALGGLLDVPELAGAAAGLALVVSRRHRAAALPVGVAVLAILGFTALGVARLPMNARYLPVPCVLLTVLAAHGIVELCRAAWARGRPAAAVTAIAVAAGAVVVLLARAGGLDDRIDSGRPEWTLRAELTRIAAEPTVRAASGSCTPRSAAYRTLSQVAFVTGTDPRAAAVTSAGPGAGLYFAPSSAAAQRLFPAGDVALLPGRTVARTANWTVLAVGC
jgi:hypothetical protein